MEVDKASQESTMKDIKIVQHIYRVPAKSSQNTAVHCSELISEIRISALLKGFS